MEQKITYQEIRNFAKKKKPDIAFVVEGLFSKIEEVINEKDIQIAYAKNLFSEDHKKLEILILTNKNIIYSIKFIGNDNCFEITAIKIKMLEEIVYKSSTHLLFNELKIKFKNGKEIVLCNETDFNDNWQSKYYNHIKEIYKLLLDLQGA
ncbi:MAG: hypothetical protein CVV03_01450 [Firmicutes bacterium HGW-Firmicutes-8]|nr:MAG: hypothetical protein CVV03_01450 [Firmicutes bacterium HGW-Firmicutes-8]